MRRESIKKNESLLQTIRRVGTGRDLLVAASETAGGKAAEDSEAKERGEAKGETNGTAPSQRSRASARTSGGDHTDDDTPGVYTRAKGEDLRSFTTAGLHRHNANKLLDMEEVLSLITRKLDKLQPPAQPDMSQLEA